jgi:hypothetical protein
MVIFICQIDMIFNVLMKAMNFDPVQIRHDATRILSAIKEIPIGSDEEVLNAKGGEIVKIFDSVRTNRFFKYTDSWGIGLGRLIELSGIEPSMDSFSRLAKSLKWVYATSLMKSWSQFSSEQIKMQKILDIQKQSLLREKALAIESFERKAASFLDKKKALQDLNESIELRRQAVLNKGKDVKKELAPVS